MRLISFEVWLFGIFEANVVRIENLHEMIKSYQKDVKLFLALAL